MRQAQQHNPNLFNAEYLLHALGNMSIAYTQMYTHTQVCATRDCNTILDPIAQYHQSTSTMPPELAARNPIQMDICICTILVLLKHQVVLSLMLVRCSRDAMSCFCSRPIPTVPLSPFAFSPCWPCCFFLCHR